MAHTFGYSPRHRSVVLPGNLIYLQTFTKKLKICETRLLATDRGRLHAKHLRDDLLHCCTEALTRSASEISFLARSADKHMFINLFNEDGIFYVCFLQ